MTLGGHIVYMCPSYLRSAWGQMMLLGPQINYALQKSCDCPINQGLVVQMLDSGIYLIICYPADKRQGKTNNCVDYVCLMDSDSSSVWHYLRLNNWGQPYIARRRVKVTTYRQEIQTFSVHVEMYCILWASTANECNIHQYNHSKWIFIDVSPSGYVMFYLQLYHINANEIHFL